MLRTVAQYASMAYSAYQIWNKPTFGAIVSMASSVIGYVANSDAWTAYSIVHTKFESSLLKKVGVALATAQLTAFIPYPEPTLKKWKKNCACALTNSQLKIARTLGFCHKCHKRRRAPRLKPYVSLQLPADLLKMFMGAYFESQITSACVSDVILKYE